MRNCRFKGRGAIHRFFIRKDNKQRICPYRFRLSGAMPLKPQQKG